MLLTIRTWFESKTDDIDWLARYAISGDSRDLERVFDCYNNDLFHYLLLQSDRQCALDISQKTWLTVMEKRYSYKEQGHPKAWLFRLARNLLLDEWRKTHKSDQFDEQKHNLSAAADMGEAIELSTLLMQLSFAQREALTLQQEGFSLHEIAQITHTNQETVKTRLRYAKDTLKKLIGAHHE